MKTHMYFLENRTVYEIVLKNIIERRMIQVTLWRMRIASRIIKATNTHSAYVLLIVFQCKNCSAFWRT
jgi:hypothetical protein